MKKNIRTIVPFFIAALVIILGILSLSSFTSQANHPYNVTGWAWSDNIGWIDMSCQNDNSCGNIDYGVQVDPQTGTFASSSYGWSSNIGWIHFGNTSCGSAIRLDTNTGAITGWAKALSPEQHPNKNGGWSGCINFGNDNRNFGVNVNMRTGDVGGFAWGADNTNPPIGIGWVDFDLVTIDLTDPDLQLFTQPPYQPGYCGDTATFQWTGQDLDPTQLCNILVDNVANQTVLPTAQNFTHILLVAGQNVSFQIICKSLATGLDVPSNTVNLSCSEPAQCGDNVDNDGDQTLDSNDSSCHTDCDENNTNSYDPTLNDEGRICVVNQPCLNRNDPGCVNTQPCTDPDDPACHPLNSGTRPLIYEN